MFKIMRQIRTKKNGQKIEILNGLKNTEQYVYYCRTCGTLMYTPNKGFDYRCADCHEKAEGWC